MGFIDNIKMVFNQSTTEHKEKYKHNKEWFLSADGRKALDDTKTTVELTDYAYQYLKSIVANKNILKDEDMYALAFVFADSIANSKQEYAGKESLLDDNLHPFVAYFKKQTRSLSNKSLCYELLLILFGAADPFDSASWLYDDSRKGYSEEEYKSIAEENNIKFEGLLQNDFAEREDIRLIACEIIWLLGKKDFMRVVY